MLKIEDSAGFERKEYRPSCNNISNDNHENSFDHENTEIDCGSHQDDDEEISSMASFTEEEENSLCPEVIALFQESDSDEEFEGFTTEDINKPLGTKDLSETSCGLKPTKRKLEHDEEKNSAMKTDEADNALKFLFLMCPEIIDLFKETSEEEEFEGFTDEDLKEDVLPLGRSAEKRCASINDVIKSQTDIDITKEKTTHAPEHKKIHAGQHRNATQLKSRKLSDFDIMMENRKDERKKMKKRNYSGSDDVIQDILSRMRRAEEEDEILSKKKLPATKKLQILPLVLSNLKKENLAEHFVDQGVLCVIADWLRPMDGKLPHLTIRNSFIRQLSEFTVITRDHLQDSGIGKVLMKLWKHPDETKENKDLMRQLIQKWARPIFNVKTDYRSLSKEERKKMHQKRQKLRIPSTDRKNKSDEESVKSEEALRSTNEEIEKQIPLIEEPWKSKIKVPYEEMLEDAKRKTQEEADLKLRKVPPKLKIKIPFEEVLQTAEEKIREDAAKYFRKKSLQKKKLSSDKMSSQTEESKEMKEI